MRSQEDPVVGLYTLLRPVAITEGERQNAPWVGLTAVPAVDGGRQDEKGRASVAGVRLYPFDGPPETWYNQIVV